MENVLKFARKFGAVLNKYGFEMVGGTLMITATILSVRWKPEQRLVWIYLLLFAEGALISAYGIERRYSYTNHALSMFFVILGACAFLPGLFLVIETVFRNH